MTLLLLELGEQLIRQGTKSLGKGQNDFQEAVGSLLIVQNVEKISLEFEFGKINVDLMIAFRIP